MARKKANIENFQTEGNSNFMALYFDMFDSKAWKQLTATDINLYLNMRRKYTARYTKGILTKSNRNDISMVKKEYLRLMSQRSFEKSIDHLIELGFIKVIESRYSTRECTIYGFSDMWQVYGTNKFIIKEEWKRSSSQISI